MEMKEGNPVKKHLWVMARPTVCSAMCPEDRGDYVRGAPGCLNTSVLVVRNNAADLCDDSRAADQEMSDSLTPRRCSRCSSPEELFTPQPTYPITTTVTDFSVCMHMCVCACELHLDLIR